MYSPREIRDNGWQAYRLERCRSQRQLDNVVDRLDIFYKDEFEIWLRKGRKFIVMKCPDSLEDMDWSDIGVKIRHIQYAIPSLRHARKIV